MKLINTGDEKWKCKYNGPMGIALSYRITNNDHKWDESDNGFCSRTTLWKDVNPNESIETFVNIDGLEPGKNSIEFSLVQESVGWFYKKNTQKYRINIEREAQLVSR